MSVVQSSRTLMRVGAENVVGAHPSVGYPWRPDAFGNGMVGEIGKRTGFGCGLNITK